MEFSFSFILLEISFMIVATDNATDYSGYNRKITIPRKIHILYIFTFTKLRRFFESYKPFDSKTRR